MGKTCEITFAERTVAERGSASTFCALSSYVCIQDSICRLDVFSWSDFAWSIHREAL